MGLDALGVVFHHAKGNLAMAAAAVFRDLMPDQRHVLLALDRERQAPDLDAPCPVFVNFVNLVHHNLNLPSPPSAVRRSAFAPSLPPRCRPARPRRSRPRRRRSGARDRGRRGGAARPTPSHGSLFAPPARRSPRAPLSAPPSFPRAW